MLLWLTFGACFCFVKRGPEFGALFGSPFWGRFWARFGPQKGTKTSPSESIHDILVFVGRHFGAKTPPDVSGQISHGTFQGNGPTGCFSKYLPTTPEISGNFAGTWSNDLLASSARQPMVTGGRAQRLQYYIILYYNILYYIIFILYYSIV